MTCVGLLLALIESKQCSRCAGVYDALKQKYLKCLLFGISEDERGSCLMEVSLACCQAPLQSQSAPPICLQL